MHSLHDPRARAALETRVRALTPSTPRRWGRMTPDQMLWHLNQAIEMSLGRGPGTMMPLPVPRALIKYVVLHLPWPKGAPTAPHMTARATYDFAAEQAKCLALIAECGAKPLDSVWGTHVAFGALSGPQASRLTAKHIDHHLRQFGL